jgi:site-specific DNA-cytosine methylase
MKYGSVCSGIEAASVAWHDLGWEPQWFSEIEQFPSEVLKHRFPAVPNLGDMTTINQNPIADERPIDLLVGGTPCQSFSVAGLRKGLADPRGNLMLTFLSIADKFRPKWVVWENVPGVLSSNGGKDFGTFLGALGELGYGFAYRVLDAQYFGVAQRRRRVFVVGYLGDWRVAAAVLFERESLQGNPKPSRKKREEVAVNVEGSVGEAGDVSCVGGNLSPTVTSKWKTGYGGPSGSNETGNMVYATTIIDRAAFSQGPNAQYEPRIEASETMSTLVAKGPHAVAQPIAFEPGKMQRLGYGYSDNGTSPTLRSEPGDNQLAVAQPIAIQDVRPIEKAQNGRGWNDDGTSYTVDTKATQGVAQPIAYSFDALSSNSMKSSNPNSGCRAVDVAKTLDTATPEPSKNQGGIAIAQPIAFKVRGGCEGGGKGYLGQEEQAFTISATQDQQIAQPISIDAECNARTNQFGTLVRGGEGGTQQFVAQPLYYESHPNDSRVNGPKDVADTVSARYGTGGGNTPLVQQPMAIRRLTPKECERLQGFPDDWTKVPYRNKEADQCPDGPRYKACGNSMAVPVMRWIGERINLIESML